METLVSVLRFLFENLENTIINGLRKISYSEHEERTRMPPEFTRKADLKTKQKMDIDVRGFPVYNLLARQFVSISM